MRISLCIGAVVAATLIVKPAEANIVVNIAQVGAGVVAIAAGSMNTSELVPSGPGGSGGFVGGDPITGWVGVGAWIESSGNAFLYGGENLTSVPAAKFTTINQFVFADTNVGPGFGISGYGMHIPQTYVSGDSLDSSSTWLNRDFADLELIAGSYVWEFANGETVTVNVVPEPTSLAIFGIGALGLFGIHRRRQSA